MGKSTSSSSKKRSRAPEEDVVDAGDSAAAVKKSKIDATGKAEVTKNGAVSEASPAKKEKKEKKDKEGKKDKEAKKEKKEKKSKADAPEEEVKEEVEEKKAKKEKKSKEDKEEKKAKKSKKDKKDKTKDAVDEDVEMTNGHTVPEANGDAPTATETPSKKSKKEKKDKKSKKSKADSNGTNDDEEPTAEDKEPEATADGATKSTRFICFIGNLPYSATVESITAHFATVHPTSVRLLTERENPAKSKGIAFVEFGRFDHMKTCLEKFHHTEFDDGISPARKINVELTAGGGGKTDKRTEKIAAKNKKLNEERAQRMAKEENAKLEKAANKPTADAAAPAEDPAEVGWIHPSRLGRVPHEDQTQEQRDEDARNATDEQAWDNGPSRKFGGGRGRGGRGGRGRGGGRGGGGGGRGGGRVKKW